MKVEERTLVKRSHLVCSRGFKGTSGSCAEAHSGTKLKGRIYWKVLSPGSGSRGGERQGRGAESRALLRQSSMVSDRWAAERRGAQGHGRGQGALVIAS